ncbi:MAG TPA: hypothetical protein DDZ51_13770 [Planctomycetaceae bacterium]|nr:hypothetical protein [Planctomycetaceae bacterium]
MKRRDFVGNVAFGGLVGAAAVGSASGQEPASSKSAIATDRPDSLMTTPMALMAPGEQCVTAIWGVSELCKGRLEWEDADGSKGTAETDPFGMVPQGTSVIRVHLSGLQPSREYRVRSVTTSASQGKTEVGPWKGFRTLNSAASETRFVVWNDTHVQNETIAKLDEVTPAADFLVWNGDTCNDWTKNDLLIPTLLNPGNRDITNKRPLMMICGNHDVRGAWAFQLPEMIATPSGRPFYAFRSGPVAAICLHTGEDKPDNHPSFAGRVAFDSLRAEQAQWLQEIITQPLFRDAPYRIVFCHIPLRWTTERIPDYDNGGYDYFSHRSRQAWHDSLVQWKTQLVISGHTHQHQWIPANDRFPYGQLTGGGPKMAQATWIEAVANAESLAIETHQVGGGQSQVIRFDPIT